MASTRRKSAAIALAVIGVAGLSLAAAAQLTVSSTQLAAGSIGVSGCDTAVSVDYTVVGANVTAVKLSNVNALCDNADYSIQLTTGVFPGTALGLPAEGTGATSLDVTGTLDTGTATVTLPAPQPVASVTGISIVLH